MKTSAKALLEKLTNNNGVPFLEFFKSGNFSMEIYKPDKVDLQNPHLQDEVYIIHSGSSKFRRGDEILDCTAGDFLFVPAQMEHRFFDFTEDFATWVIFY